MKPLLPSPIHRRSGPLLLALCTLLSACSLLVSKPQASLQSYTLESVSPQPPLAPSATPVPTGTRVLLVEQPSAAAGFDSKHMLYVRQPLTQEWYTQSTWVDTPARMLAPLLVQALQGSGAFRAVVLAPSAAQAELRLDTEVVRLQQNFLQTPSSVRFTLQVTLSDNHTHAVLAWRLLDVVQVAPSEDAAGGSAAASAAVQQALQQLAGFVGEQVRVLNQARP
jgi:cholesterol transport system auxiliary component